MPMKMKNKFLKRVRAVALAAVLFCTPIIGAVVVSPIQAEAATTINGLTINQKLQTINASSRYGRDIDYIVVHYTGAPGSAVNNATYFANGYRGASAHYFVGYSGEVWQSVSDSLAAWSVGGNKYPGTKGGSVYGKCTNYNSINIEMCVRTSGSRSDTSKDWYFENATINSTVKLVQGLMKKYNVPLSRVVRHYDVVGKYCPNPFVLNDDPVTWSSFKSMVAGDGMVQLSACDVLHDRHAHCHLKKPIIMEHREVCLFGKFLCRNFRFQILFYIINTALHPIKTLHFTTSSPGTLQLPIA